jgi:DNA-directed RNA polymerase specialized sigma24 family protein
MGAELTEIEALYRESYLRYRDALATVTGSYETARDAVQQALARAVADRGHFRGDDSLGAWVWRSAPREACALRSELAHAQLNGALDPVLVEPEQDPLLAAAVASLPPRA